jgi:glycosyltransferase involved in cell wall biosynthesis
VARKYSLPERYFLYLGGFDVRKNVLGIVRAYRLYLDLGGDPAVQLVVAGRLPRLDTAFFPDPQRLVRQLDLTGQVRFIGWVEEEDKAPLYAGATAFLFPSKYEGFGMMLLEAMAAGTPVITSSE